MANAANSSISDLLSVVHTSTVNFDSIPALVLRKEYLDHVYQAAAHSLTLSSMWKLLVAVLFISNFKNFPLVYHLRILNAVRFVLRSQRPKKDVTPDQLFQPLIMSARAPLAESDVYGHKSNSTYFSDVDVARAYLVTTLFGKAIHKIRGSTTMNGLSGSSSKFTMAIGAVSCSFKSPLLPYEKYDMWTRVLSWDEKWIYLVTHFVKSGANITPREYTLYPEQRSMSVAQRKGSNGLNVGSPRKNSTASNANGGRSLSSPIAASAMSKIVFKNGRITMAPKVILEAAGLLVENPVERDEDDHRVTLARAQIVANDNKIPLENSVEPVIAMTDEPSKQVDKATNGVSWEMIEAERLRGMKMAKLLSQQTSLEDEFCDGLALGRHHDGWGVEGVVATLANLSRLTNYQLL